MNGLRVSGEVMTLDEFYDREQKKLRVNAEYAIINGECIGFDTERWQEVKDMRVFVSRLMDEIYLLTPNDSGENGRDLSEV